MVLDYDFQQNFDSLRDSVHSNNKKRTNVMMSKKVKKYLKSKYGTTSAGINALALKDMGEL